jgi:hypothetical protein
MRKETKLTKAEISNMVKVKLSKVFCLLAQKYTLRKIEKMIHIDRMDISNNYRMSNIKISFEFADKVAKYVLRYKPSIEEITEKFTKRGLSALIEYKELSDKKEEEILSIKVKKMREQDNLSFIEIGKKINLCCNTAQRLYQLSKGNKGKRKNVIFEKCDKRDKVILSDHKENGLSTTKIAEKYNISKRQARSILCNKFNVVYQRRKISDDDIKRIVVLREQHKLTWPSIGYIYQLSSGSVQYYYNDYYVQKEKQNYKT